MDDIERVAMRLADDYADEFVSLAGRIAITQALRNVREAALEEAAQVAENEPELPGDPPPEHLALMLAIGVVESSRVAVRSTKNSIVANIRALKATADHTTPAQPTATPQSR